MIDRIKQFFLSQVPEESSADRDALVKSATAALMVEVMVTDNLIHEGEEKHIQKLLEDNFSLSSEESAELFQLARDEVAEATSLYQFTGLVNEYLDPFEKAELIYYLWQVAYADGNLDKYEEAVVRKVAELIHVPHSHFLRAKLRARD